MALALVATGRARRPRAAGATIWIFARIVYLPIYLTGVIYVRTALWAISVIGLCDDAWAGVRLLEAVQKRLRLADARSDSRESRCREEWQMADGRHGGRCRDPILSDEHPPPHFHAVFAEFVAQIALRRQKCCAGRCRPRN